MGQSWGIFGKLDRGMFWGRSVGHAAFFLTGFRDWQDFFVILIPLTVFGVTRYGWASAWLQSVRLQHRFEARITNYEFWILKCVACSVERSVGWWENGLYGFYGLERIFGLASIQAPHYVRGCTLWVGQCRMGKRCGTLREAKPGYAKLQMNQFSQHQSPLSAPAGLRMLARVFHLKCYIFKFMINIIFHCIIYTKSN